MTTPTTRILPGKFLDKGGVATNVMHPDFGVTGLGVVSDAIGLAVTNTAAANGTLVFPPGTYKISADITFSSNVTLRFEQGAVLSIDVGKTVTCNGTVIALNGMPHSGAGAIAYNNPTNWFGNQYGFGFGTHEPDNTDDFFHLERNTNGATGILLKNLSTGAVAEAFIHLWGGAQDVSGSDLRITTQSAAMGGEVVLSAKCNSLGTNPSAAFSIINASNAPVAIFANNKKQFQVLPTANTVNTLTVKGSATGSAVILSCEGTDANINIAYDSKGVNGHLFRTNNGAQTQVFISHTASATRYLVLTGSNGGNPVVDVSAGALRLSAGTSDIQWGKALVALGGGAAPTLGTIGGSGPATAAQNSWMRVLDSAGVAFWVPAWK